MSRTGLPGAVVVAVQGDHVVLARAYGMADPDAARPMDAEHTVFPVGSLSKLFTATAAMQLVERGVLSLDSDLRRDARALISDDHRLEPITLADLLTHTSGLDAFNTGIAWRASDHVSAAAPPLLDRLPQRVGPPGAVFRYSNQGIAFVGYVVEHAGGVPFDGFIADHILSPLGMTGSGVACSPSMRPNLAAGFLHLGDTHVPAPRDIHLRLRPATTLYVTAADMGRFIAANLAPYDGNDPVVLRPETFRLMHQRRFAYHPRLPGWALGFAADSVRGVRVLHHGGAAPGMFSHLMILPDDGIGYFLAYNSDDRSLHAEVRDTFLRHIVPADVGQPASRVASGAAGLPPSGLYCDLEVSSTTIERISGLWSGVHVDHVPSGGVQLTRIDDGEITQWLPEEPGLLKRVDGDEYIAFDAPPDERPRLFRDMNAYQKATIFETPAAHLAMASAFFAAFASALPLGWRAIRRPRSPDRTAMAGLFLAMVAGSNLVFIGGIIAVAMGHAHLEFIFGPPRRVAALLIIPLVTASLTPVVLFTAAWAWRGDVSRGRRLHLLILAVALTAFPLYLSFWNLFGFHY